MRETPILVVMAAKMESKGRIEKLNSEILYTGVGKVNAAIKLSTRLASGAPKPKVVLNLGTAGSHLHPVGSLLQADQFFQADMDATALNFKAFQTPFEQEVEIRNPLKLEHLPTASVYTADKFITDKSLGYALMDMEAYALAKTCQNFSQPFLCVKYVSDGADQQSVNWRDTLEHASLKLSEFLGDFLKGDHNNSCLTSDY